MTKAEKAVQMILPEVAGRVVLEVACGCAEFSLAAAKHAKQVVCIDLDHKRLDPAVTMRSNIAFLQMDAAQMLLADDSLALPRRNVMRTKLLWSCYCGKRRERENGEGRALCLSLTVVVYIFSSVLCP